MPLVDPSYAPPRWLRNGHAHTVLARFLRTIPLPAYQRHRLELEDGDFIDLDEISGSHRRTALLLHGLESSSSAAYVRGMARTLLGQGWDIVAMNFRGCSGEPNRVMRSYHSGVTDDLGLVIRHLRTRAPDHPLALVGFSLGGNVVLRYLGEQGADAKKHGISVAAAISVPTDLKACAERFAEPENKFYMNRFLRSLLEKTRYRQIRFPEALDYESVLQSKNFHDFDGRFTAPVHGFASAEDYWARCSSKATAGDIALPTLLINALDDPFLSPSCHLVEEARDHPNLFADVPRHGGHVGFVRFSKGGYYQESQVSAFFRERS